MGMADHTSDLPYEKRWSTMALQARMLSFIDQVIHEQYNPQTRGRHPGPLR
jgi:hypothetical protein